MNARTMGGLVGGSVSVNLMNTPVAVFKEARHKGDTAAMERAMGYADELSHKAQEYKTEADKGMKEDAKEVKEQEKLRRKELIRKRKEEREKQNTDINVDTVTISEEGKASLKANTVSDGTGSDESPTDEGNNSVTYSKTGETILPTEDGSVSVSV